MKNKVNINFFRNTIRTLNRIEEVTDVQTYVNKFGDLYGIEFNLFDPTEGVDIDNDYKNEADIINLKNFVAQNFYQMQEHGNTMSVVVGVAIDKYTKRVFRHLWLVTSIGEHIETNLQMIPEDYLYYALYEFDSFELVKKSENENLDDAMGVVAEDEKEIFNPEGHRPPHKPFHPIKPREPKHPWIDVQINSLDWIDIKEYVHPVAKYEVEYYTTQPQI